MPSPDLQSLTTAVADTAVSTEPGTPPDDRLLRASEVQRELGISRATAYRLMTNGTLPAYRFGGRKGSRPMVRVSLWELRKWIAAHRSQRTDSATC
jgi:excisionase family DNA binding protein